MNDFFHNLLGLLRLRAGPQDLPASWPLTMVAIAAYFGQSVLTGQTLGLSNNGNRVLLALAVQILALALVLKFRRCLNRFQQSLLALMLTGLIFGLAFYLVQMQNDPGVAVQPFWALVVIGLFFWGITVDGNIYRHAISDTLPVGVLIAVGIFAVTYIVDYFLFPPT
jgi:hypothetical protein